MKQVAMEMLLKPGMASKLEGVNECRQEIHKSFVERLIHAPDSGCGDGICILGFFQCILPSIMSLLCSSAKSMIRGLCGRLVTNHFRSFFSWVAVFGSKIEDCVMQEAMAEVFRVCPGASMILTFTLAAKVW